MESIEESYHSKYGAIQESRHVFIEAGLRYVKKRLDRSIGILEIGFGTGLNTFLTAAEDDRDIFYTAIDPYPVPKSIYSGLNYPEKSALDPSLFESLHEAPWEKKVSITPSFTLFKTTQSFFEIPLTEPIDLIYFDAFSPTTQPELWTTRVFKRLHECLSSTGVLVSYCCKGSVKDALRDAGFSVTRLQGPKGKRHMSRAEKGA